VGHIFHLAKTKNPILKSSGSLILTAAQNYAVYPIHTDLGVIPKMEKTGRLTVSYALLPL